MPDASPIVTIQCLSCKTDIELEQDYFNELDGQTIDCPSCNAKIKILQAEPKGRIKLRSTQTPSEPNQNPGLSTAQTKPCVGCGTEIAEDAVICVSCGMNQMTGRPVTQSQESGKGQLEAGKTSNQVSKRISRNERKRRLYKSTSWLLRLFGSLIIKCVAIAGVIAAVVFCYRGCVSWQKKAIITGDTGYWQTAALPILDDTIIDIYFNMIFNGDGTYCRRYYNNVD